MKKLYAVMIGLLVLALLPVRHIAWAATVTVNSTTDVSDGDTSSIANLITSPGPDGVISLREAIEAASNTSGSDTINFNTSVFPLANPATIAILSPLPTIGSDTTIDGSGAGVILDGGGAPGGTQGLVIDGASNVVIKGLQILNFPSDGISLQNGASNNTIGGTNATPDEACSGDCNLISGNGNIGISLSGNDTMSNTVSGNYIGTDVNGTAAPGNVSNGVFIKDGAQRNVIGGTTAGERNIISRSSTNQGIHIMGGHYNTIIGNFIGVDASGTFALGNHYNGILVSHGAQHNVIGGDTASERNIISGNDENGVGIRGSGTMSNTVSGNYIGTNVNGTSTLGNSDSGVRIENSASNNTIGGNNASPGGACSGDCNLISGNNWGVGIVGAGATNNTVTGNFIGTDISGTAAINNIWSGVEIGDGAQYNAIGGDTAGERNVISGNGDCGIIIGGTGTMNNTVSGNYIGTDVSGTTGLGNARAWK